MGIKDIVVSMELLKTPCYDMTKGWISLLNSLADDTDRNAKIVSEVIKDTKEGRTILVATKFVGHAHELDYLISNDLEIGNSEVITLASKVSDRMQTLDRIRSRKTQVLVTTYTGLKAMSLNLKELDTLYLTLPEAFTPGSLTNIFGRLLREDSMKQPPLVRIFTDPKIPKSLASCFKVLAHRKEAGFKLTLRTFIYMTRLRLKGAHNAK